MVMHVRQVPGEDFFFETEQQALLTVRNDDSVHAECAERDTCDQAGSLVCLSCLRRTGGLTDRPAN